MDLFLELVKLNKGCRNFALCTVVAQKGSTPRKVSAKMIVIDDQSIYGSILGTIGGGAIEHAIRQKAVMLIRNKQAKLITMSLRNDLGMCCGGEMSIFVEPIMKKPKLICFGAGHIAQNLCPLAQGLGFEVVVVDERAELLASEAFSLCERIDHGSALAVPEHYFVDSFMVVATHDHGRDQSIVESIIHKPFLYAALVGSQRKALMTKKRMLAKGIEEEFIQRIRVPAGIKIHAETPQEIAVSIAAEMVRVKHEANQNRSPDRSSWSEPAHGSSQGMFAD